MVKSCHFDHVDKNDLDPERSKSDHEILIESKDGWLEVKEETLGIPKHVVSFL